MKKRKSVGRRSLQDVERLGSARDAILSTAIQLLNERGPGNVSLHDVSKSAKVNVALVRYYFGSKDALYQAVVTSIIEIWSQQLDAAVQDAATPKEQLRARIGATLKIYSRFPYLTRLIVQQMMKGPGAEGKMFLERFTKQKFAQQKKLLKEGYEQGEFRKIDPALFFVSYVGLLDFMFVSGPLLKAVLGVEKPDERLLDRFIEHSADLLLLGLAKR